MGRYTRRPRCNTALLCFIKPLEGKMVGIERRQLPWQKGEQVNGEWALMATTHTALLKLFRSLRKNHRRKQVFPRQKLISC